MADGKEGGKRARTPRKNPSPRKRQCTYNIYTPSASPENVQPKESEDVELYQTVQKGQEDHHRDNLLDGSPVRRSARNVSMNQGGQISDSDKEMKTKNVATIEKTPTKPKKKGKMAKVKASIAKMEAKIAKMKKKLGTRSTDVSSTAGLLDDSKQEQGKKRNEPVAILKTSSLIDTYSTLEHDSVSEGTIVSTSQIPPQAISSIDSLTNKDASSLASNHVSQKMKCLGASSEKFNSKDGSETCGAGIKLQELAEGNTVSRSSNRRQSKKTKGKKSLRKVSQEGLDAPDQARKSHGKELVTLDKESTFSVEGQKEQTVIKPCTEIGSNSESLSSTGSSPKVCEGKTSGGKVDTIVSKDKICKSTEISDEPHLEMETSQKAPNSSPRKRSPRKSTTLRTSSESSPRTQVNTRGNVSINRPTQLGEANVEGKRYMDVHDGSSGRSKVKAFGCKLESQDGNSPPEEAVISPPDSEKTSSPDVNEEHDQPHHKSWKSPSGKTPKVVPLSMCTARILRKSVEKVRRRVVFSPENKKSVRRLVVSERPHTMTKRKMTHSPRENSCPPVLDSCDVDWVDADMQPISDIEEESVDENKCNEVLSVRTEPKQVEKIEESSSNQLAKDFGLHQTEKLNAESEVRTSRRLAIKRKLKLETKTEGKNKDKKQSKGKTKAPKKEESKGGNKSEGKKAPKKRSSSKKSDVPPVLPAQPKTSQSKSKLSKKKKKVDCDKRKRTSNSGPDDLDISDESERSVTSKCSSNEAAPSLSNKGSEQCKKKINDSSTKASESETIHEDSAVSITPESIDDQIDYNLHILDSEGESPSKEIDSLALVLLSLNEDSQHLQSPVKEASVLCSSRSPPSTPSRRTPKKTPLKINFKFRTPTKTPPKTQRTPSKVETTSRSPARFVGHFSSKVKGSQLSFHDDQPDDRLASPTKIERLTCSGIEVLDTQASDSRPDDPYLNPQPGTSGEQKMREPTRRPIRRSLNLGRSPKLRNSPRKRILQKNALLKKHYGGSPGKNRKRKESVDTDASKSDLADSPQGSGLQIVEDDNDSDWEDEETDERLDAHAQAQPIKLTATNVRTIIKEVISHSGVIDMVKNTLMGIGDKFKESLYEPKRTRSQVKRTLTQDGSIPGIWPLSSIGESKSGVSKSFTELNFSEDDEDEDYDPLNDYDQLNELSDADSESVLSSRASDFGSPRSQTTPTPTHTKPLTPGTETAFAADNPALTPTEEPPLPYRLRSKLSLEDTPLEEIEANFVAPDITADLYDTVCDDKDWMAFLNTLTKTGEAEMNDTYDEKNDPEYNIMEDNEDVDNEDYRNDKAVKVTQKEIDELCAELCDIMPNELPDEDSQDDLLSPCTVRGPKDKVTKPAVPTKSSYKPKVPPIIMDSPASLILVGHMSELQGISANEKDESFGLKSSNELSNTHLEFTCDDEYIQLQDHMRKHVQLLAQTYVLADPPAFEAVRHQAVVLLNEIHRFGMNNFLRYQKPSFFQAVNLDGAIAITQKKLPEPPSDRLQLHVYKALHKKGWKRALGHPQKIAPTWPHMDVFCTNKVFIFPQMLPEIRFYEKDKLPSFQIFTEAEDTLLVQGLDQFSKMGTHAQVVDLIRTYLLPVKTSKQIQLRIKRLRYVSSDNIVKEYYRTKQVPELETYKALEDPEDICPAEDRDPSLLPTWFKVYASIKQRYRSGKINLDYDPETGTLRSDTPDSLDGSVLSDIELDGSYVGKQTPGSCQTRRCSSRREANKMAREAANVKAAGHFSTDLSKSITHYVIPASGVTATINSSTNIGATPSIPFTPMVVISSEELQEYGAQMITSPGLAIDNDESKPSDSVVMATSTPRRVEAPLLTNLQQKQLSKISTESAPENVAGNSQTVLDSGSNVLYPKNYVLDSSPVPVTAPLVMSPIHQVMAPGHSPLTVHSVPPSVHSSAITQPHGITQTLTVVSSIGKHPLMSPAQTGSSSQTVMAPGQSPSAVQVITSDKNVMSPAHVLTPASPMNNPSNEPVKASTQVMSPALTVLSPAHVAMSPMQTVMSPIVNVNSPAQNFVSADLNTTAPIMSPVHSVSHVQTMASQIPAVTSQALLVTSPHVSLPSNINERSVAQTEDTEPNLEVGAEPSVLLNQAESQQNNTSHPQKLFNVPIVSLNSQHNASSTLAPAVGLPVTESMPSVTESFLSHSSTPTKSIRPFNPGGIEGDTDARSSILSPFKTPHKPKHGGSHGHNLSPANILLTGGIKSAKDKRAGPDLEEGSTILEGCQLHLEPDHTTSFNESSDKSPDESDLSGYVMETPRKFIPNEDCSRSPTVYSNSSFSNSPGYSDGTPTKKDYNTPTKSAVEMMAAFADCINTPVRRPPADASFLSPQRQSILIHETGKSPSRFGMKTPVKFRNIFPKDFPVTPPKALSPIPRKVSKSPRRRILQQKARAILPKGFVASTYAISPTKKAAASLTRRARSRSGFRKILAKPTTNKPVSDDTDDVLATADENEDTDIDVLETDPASEYDTLESEFASEDNQSAEEKENNEKAVTVKVPADAPPKPKRQRRWKKKPKKKAEYNDSASDNEDGFGVGIRFGHDSQDEGDEDDPLARFMAASTTIRFDPKRSTSTSDRQIKSKSKLKREMTLHMLAPDLVESDVMRDERDTAFAQAYLARARELLASDKETLERFLQLMFDFGKSDKTPVELHKSVQEVLRDYPSLLEEFSGFLLPEQAQECGCFVTNGEFTRVRTFLRKLEVFFSKHPSHLQKIYKVLNTWSKRENLDSKEFRDQIIPLLRGQQHLVDEFTKLINSEKPVQQMHADDYEVVTIPEDDDSREFPPPEPDLEEIVLGESAEDALYGTSRCKCRCHAVSDKFFFRRRKHCDSCSMKTMEKTLRPVQVQFVGGKPQPQSRTRVEEDGGPKDDGISSDEEAYRDPPIEADGEPETGPPPKKRRRIKNSALKVKLPCHKTLEQSNSENVKAQVNDSLPVIDVAQDSILVPDTAAKEGDSTPCPTDFSQLRQELISDQKLEAVAVDVKDASVEKSLQSGEVGDLAGDRARQLIVETSMMGMETPLKLRPMMRVASKDIRMTQIPSDSENSNSNSHSGHSNTQGSAPSNDGVSSTNSKNMEVDDDTGASNPVLKSRPQVDIDETANMGVETSKESSLNKERILLKLNINQNDSSSSQHQSAVTSSSLGKNFQPFFPEESCSADFRLSDSKLVDSVDNSAEGNDRLPSAVQDIDIKSEKNTCSKDEKQVDPGQSSIEGTCQKKDWTREEDKELLLTCKLFKPIKDTFEKISASLSSHPTPLQVEQRFRELLSFYEHDISNTSTEASSEEETEDS